MNDESSISRNKVISLFEDSRGRLWMGTGGGGLNLFNRDKNTFEHHYFNNNGKNKSNSNNNLLLSNDHIIAINEDYRGKLWLGTRNGLIRFDPDKKIFTRYLHTQESNSLSDNIVYHINKDSKQRLWISTDNGLNIYNEEDDNFIRFQYNERKPDGISARAITTSYESENGNIWIGALHGGVNRYNPKNAYFKHMYHEPESKNTLLGNSVHSIYQDKQNRIWIGTTDGGLNQYNPQTKQFTYYLHNPDNQNSISENIVGKIYQDSKDFFWIATYHGGLNRFDEKTGKFQHFIRDERDKNSISDNTVYDILEDYQGILWIGTLNGGLNQFNHLTQEFKHFRHDPNDETSISSNDVRIIHQDKHNTLWVGTRKGLNYLDREKNQFVRYQHSIDNSNSISHNSVISIHESTSDGLWIGTGIGFNYFDKKTKRFTRYYTKDGLPSNTIYSIEEDNEGNLWLATVNGLSKFNPKTQLFKNYSAEDGLQSDQFNPIASMTASNGELYFGGINGITSFHPEQIQVDLQAPKVAITRFLLFNEPVSITADVINNSETDNAFTLKKDIGFTSELTLNHEQSLFAFDFVALYYANPYKSRYAYKLDGWDKNWIYTDYKIRRASYTNIPSGNYTFRVKASNGDDAWNEQGASIRINISPAPWKTWWAYTLYCLFFICLFVILFILMLQNKYAKVHQNELQREKQITTRLSDLDKLKDEFLANTSHELRTPLNGIIGLSESLMDRADDEICRDAKKNIEIVVASGKRLANLVNDILDFSKLKNCDLQLAIKNVDLYSVVNAVLTVSRSLMVNKPVELINQININFPYVSADENRLQQILFNLVGNAIKFTHSGEVSITAECIGEKVSVFITDTGIGIPENKLETIFQSFQQVDGDTAKLYGGTGLGLTVTKQLVELHGGNVSVTSTMGKGSVFTFSLIKSKTKN